MGLLFLVAIFVMIIVLLNWFSVFIYTYASKIFSRLTIKMEVVY